MSIRSRLANLERSRSKQPHPIRRHLTNDGWVVISRQDKAIFALPDNGRGDCYA